MQTLSIFPECAISISTIDDGSIRTYEDLTSLELKSRPLHQLYLSTHTHATDTWLLSDQNRDQLVFPADIVLTEQKKCIVTHQFADCVPVLCIDRGRKAFCFAHLGWRGLVSGGIQIAILAMRAHFKTAPEDLWIWIGPCIRKESYRANNRPAQADLPTWQQYLTQVDLGETIQWAVDLPGFIKSQCARFGADPERIIDDGRDTYSEHNHFFSHQRWVQQQNQQDKGNFIVAVSLT